MDIKHNDNIVNSECTLGNIVKMALIYWTGVLALIGVLFGIFGLN